MTLYWGYRENKACNRTFLPSNSIGKVEDVVQFSKPHKDKNNHNTYALVGDTLDIYCLGTVKEQATKYNGKIFLGQKVYALSKEDLCLYYKDAVRQHRNIVDEAMKRAEQCIANLDLNVNVYNRDFQYHWAIGEIERLKHIIKDSESQYKNPIERIKKL